MSEGEPFAVLGLVAIGAIMLLREVLPPLVKSRVWKNGHDRRKAGAPQIDEELRAAVLDTASKVDDIHEWSHELAGAIRELNVNVGFLARQIERLSGR